MRKLIKKLPASARLAGTLLKHAPSIELKHGQLADALDVITLSDGSQAQLALPHHTHLSVGDVLVDEQGMMVRIAGAIQTVVAVSSNTSATLAPLAWSLGQSGWAVAFDGSNLLTEPVEELIEWLKQQGFEVTHTQGRLDPPSLRAPVRSHSHDHSDNEHSHGHHKH
ncbi:MAG: hypothetical protein K1X48_03780 [Burkholderiaceae bacterium]|nr:hypothetical protein [Burkholderiaceae bacterium]